MLFLSYSAFRPASDVDPELLERARGGEEAARREVMSATDVVVGNLIKDALLAEGLQVEWNGTNAQRIGARVPEWRKPLPKG
jgi:hypothetical protein